MLTYLDISATQHKAFLLVSSHSVDYFSKILTFGTFKQRVWTPRPTAAYRWLKIAFAEPSSSFSLRLESLFLRLSPFPPSLIVAPWGLMNHTHTPKAVQRRRKNTSASKKQNKGLKRHLGGKLRNQETRQQGLPRLRSQTVCFASYVDAATLFLPVWFCPAGLLLINFTSTGHLELTWSKTNTSRRRKKKGKRRNAICKCCERSKLGNVSCLKGLVMV